MLWIITGVDKSHWKASGQLLDWFVLITNSLLVEDGVSLGKQLHPIQMPSTNNKHTLSVCSTSIKTLAMCFLQLHFCAVLQGHSYTP